MPAEALLQYLWEHRLWDYTDLKTTDGHTLQIIDQGRRNTDAGPDFFNAKIRIDGQDWAGNVEVHTVASDWHRHRHHTDPAYHSVVLHVVGKSDCTVNRPDGSAIPQVEMKYAPNFRERYMSLVENTAPGLACAADIRKMPQVYFVDWVTSVAYERIYERADHILETYSNLNGEWGAAAYTALARGLGFSTNSDPFERLAAAAPLSFLKKHADDPRMLQGALFGQAGFLDIEVAPGTPEAEFIDQLRCDHQFFKRKYGLPDTTVTGWKMARMRPPNFPHRRIAALAAMLESGFVFGQDFLHVQTLSEARELFRVELSPFWSTHYTFTAAASQKRGPVMAFSPATTDLLVINVLVPMLFAFGMQFGDERRITAAASILQDIAPEDNHVTRIFTKLGLPCRNALESQGLIQLSRAYCEKRKCLYCRLGHRFLANRVAPEWYEE